MSARVCASPGRPEVIGGGGMIFTIGRVLYDRSSTLNPLGRVSPPRGIRQQWSDQR